MVDYHKLCKSIASRYRVTSDQREDLIQEGYLAYLECVEKGCSHPDVIETSIRHAMYDYTNFKQRPIEIPSRKEYYGLKKRWESLESLDGLSPTEKALYFALTGEYVSVDALDKEGLDESHEDFLALGMAVTKALDEQEASVFRKIALHGYTQEEVSASLGMSQQRVSQLYQGATEKLREILL
jgi:RNA polymerase sigma factor (sigma-70 family)